ncbi:MAG: ketosteroid isomerase-like protein [Gammaproteobacteria bacterium]|jgi:ketosteroid isomerase-like protein
MSNNADVAATIDKNNKKFCATLAAGNAAGVAALYANNARLMATNSETVSNNGLTAFWQGIIDMGVRDGTLISDTVEVHGDTAIEVGKYVLYGDNRTALDNGKYVVVWKNEGGDWKLKEDIFNSSVAAA